MKRFVQGDSFLAGSKGIWRRNGEMFEVFCRKLRSFSSKCNLGYVFLSSFGAIQGRQIDGRFRADSGHIVGFTDGLDWKIRTEL
jgi:uncharacterized protein (AIM24 family)